MVSFMPVFDTPITTDAGSLKKVLAQNLPVVLYLYDSRQGNSKPVEDAFTKIAKKHAGELLVARVDVAANPDVHREYGSLPTPAVLTLAKSLFSRKLKSQAGSIRPADIRAHVDYLLDRGPQPAAPEPPQTPEPARFAAYYPRDVKPHHWQPLRAYMLRASASQAVQADALAQFGPRTDIRATTREALRPVAEDALVTAIPSLPGFEFDPPQVSLRFRGGWRRFDFEFQAASAPLDASTDGHITFLVEGVIVADVPISVYVTLTAGESELRPQMALSEPYQAIFCSYSHKDSAIVERVERASRYFNFRYLRDVTALRSGEVWNARLLELIDSADIFQLFWSRHAAESEYVRQEVQYAVALRRKGAKSPVFIRPIRWEEPMPAPPPPELSDLHFDLIPELAQEEPRDEMDLF
ncbi:TIR domain-containing protein [Anaerolineae bacterium CFX8]|nr:TIR domain-containing protein [Anaerolineae bacterium CFX8]